MTVNVGTKTKLLSSSIDFPLSYSLLVFGNQNLQELWPSRIQNLSNPSANEVLVRNKIVIKSGKAFFHINPKLCYKTIEKMMEYVDIVKLRGKSWRKEEDIDSQSNGDKVACDVYNLDVNVWSVGSEMVGIQWSNFRRQLDDHRHLLGYLIYYREA